MKSITIIFLVFVLLLTSCSLESQDSTTQVPQEVNTMKLTSSAFTQGEMIPSKYTCDGENINPELTFHDIPEKAVSLVLIMDDPDIPDEIKKKMGIGVFDHWVMFNIMVERTESSVPGMNRANMLTVQEDSAPGMQGANTRAQAVYTGPCPPPQYNPKIHRYFFKAYALDMILPLQEGASRERVEKAMQGHIITKTELMGRYSRE